jgi:ABC-type antimicrobial peptide transport system permease subunit
LIGKLIIIGIIVATLIILVPNSSKLFQSVPSLDAVKNKIDNTTNGKEIINASKSAIREISLGAKLGSNLTGSTLADVSPISSIISNNTSSVYQLPPQYVNKQNYAGQVFEKTGDTCQISVPALAQSINGQTELTHIIQLGQCSLGIGDPVQVTTLDTKPGSPPVTPSSGLQISPYYGNSGSTSSSPPLPPYYSTIQLTTVNQGSNSMLNFTDSSGQTKSVTVTMKNSDTVLFTGTFYSSKFTADVKDVPNTPHVIELTIDNALYGTLHASAYAPSNMQNSTITGILSQ